MSWSISSKDVGVSYPLHFFSSQFLNEANRIISLQMFRLRPIVGYVNTSVVKMPRSLKSHLLSKLTTFFHNGGYSAYKCLLDKPFICSNLIMRFNNVTSLLLQKSIVSYCLMQIFKCHIVSRVVHVSELYRFAKKSCSSNIIILCKESIPFICCQIGHE